ncbi:MAG: hypothetical protein AABX30_00385 [Nanoarchaeota archaeon]
MPEKLQYSERQYQKALTQIRNFAQKNTHLWSEGYIKESVTILCLCLDAQDNDYGYYSVGKENDRSIGFYIRFKHEKARQIPLKKLAKCIKEEESRYGISPSRLISHFVGEIRKPLTEYETARAKISEKVKRKLEPLEDLTQK